MNNRPTIPDPPVWALAEDETAYHAAAKSGAVMSSGMLKRFRQCPYAYRQHILGNNREQDKAAYRFGRAVHKIVLEGIPAFNKAYAIGGPLNPKTGRAYGPGTLKHDEWLAANGYAREQVITDEESNALVAMANAARGHALAARLLESGWPGLAARGVMAGVECQMRMDWFTRDADGGNVVIDLKTTEDIAWFEADARRYHYPFQLAFYRDLFRIRTGEPVALRIVALEKKFPFRVGLWSMPDETLDLYSAGNALALDEFRKCRETDVWPTGYEGERIFGFPKTVA
jgi:hypothetical protein